MSFDRKAERIAWGITGLTILSLAVTAAVWLMPSLRSSTSRDPVAYVVGDRIDLPPELYAAKPLTAVLFARSSCAACRNMTTFYREVVAELRGTPTLAMMMISGLGDERNDLSYALELGLVAEEFRSINLTTLRIRRVPTLVIVDRQGTVIASWHGAPDEAERVRFPATLKQILPPDLR